MNKDEIMQTIAKTTTAVIALQAIVAGIHKQNTKEDAYMDYVCDVIVEAMDRERRKQMNASKELVNLMAQEKEKLS